MGHDAVAKCPFCGFVPGAQTEPGDEAEYALLLHIETHHSDGQSPFVDSEGPVTCPQEGCGELVSHDELAFHIGLHELEAEESAGPADQFDEQGPSKVIKTPAVTSDQSGTTHKRRLQGGALTAAWKELFDSHRSKNVRESSQRIRHRRKKHVSIEHASSSAVPDEQARSLPNLQGSTQVEEKKRQIARLGKSELGRYAHEKKMPDWLVTLLNDQGQVITEGIIPVLSQLLEQNVDTQIAYVCHPSVLHVSKLRREGGFCGYRNIQMLISHIIGAQTAGSGHFGPTFPTIFQIQDLVENAWDMGFNAQGRVETGGIKGTRKYIGTPEAQAVFCSLGIPNSVQAFKDKERGKAKDLLLQAIEQYFQGGVENIEARIHLTQLPPIYLQHPGHSLTIVGIEKQIDGQVNLLVFDPTFRDSGKIRHLVGKVFRHRPATVNETLQPYRRGGSYLRRYTEFEVLYLVNRLTF